MNLPNYNQTHDIDYDFDTEEITFNTDQGLFGLKISREDIFWAVFDDVEEKDGQLIATVSKCYSTEIGRYPLTIQEIMGEYIYTAIELHKILKDNIDKVTVDTTDVNPVGADDDIDIKELQNGITKD